MRTPVDIVAVVGPDTPQRSAYAGSRARRDGRPVVISADALRHTLDPIEAAITMLEHTPADRVVIELPGHLFAPHVIGTFADHGDAFPLTEIVCIVDAALALPTLSGIEPPTGFAAPWAVARPPQSPAVAVSQIEFASTLLLVNWEAVPTTELSMLMALVNHLAPTARLCMRAHEPAGVCDHGHVTPYPAAQERPGWVALLNEEFAPHMTDPRVRAFRYEQFRPFHPGRLKRLLEREIGTGAFGTVIRSAGFCRLATRSHLTAQWNHTGPSISFTPLANDGDLDEHDLLSVGQDLAFIGLDLREGKLRAALDSATLTDHEFADGPVTWRDYPDPLPSWEPAPRAND
ncbi:cobalamin biosynthesis protein CobW [Pseudoclavibacter endophyticus]|uniref:CobW C-terminal domain-containing protein n=1 Tax=Pseudoclavibacter endophyticus TaxID=1778590 RepID=A0A6H9WBW9_9MICO|nr:GTP-binding protein [Pseudoclavibacter endophyticus]KAB1648160.1 hypothetical protein F8O04_10605 [Pseudoclavibacter endophyticus]GGA70219.1 cobalamin biosynthesis protein CobW [Pseudoclavibacter endophyticus]